MLSRKLAEFERLSQLPSPEDLLQARKRRDQLWSEVQQQWQSISSTGNPSAETDQPSRFEPSSEVGTSNRDLSGEFTRSILDADKIADRLRNDAEQIAQHESMKSRLAEHQEQCKNQQAKLSSAVKDFQKSQLEWHSLWKPTGIVPLTPLEMMSWWDIFQSYRKLEMEHSSNLRTMQTYQTQRKSLMEPVAKLFSQLNAQGFLSHSESPSWETLESCIEHADTVQDRMLQHCTEKKRTGKADGICHSNRSGTQKTNRSGNDQVDRISVGMGGLCTSLEIIGIGKCSRK